MPLYEYRCESCQQVFEVMQKFSDAPLTTHEGCGGHVARLLSAPAFHLKGGGWYITDYARAGSGGKDKAGDAAKSDSGGKESSKDSSGGSGSGGATEAKPAAKPDTKSPDGSSTPSSSSGGGKS